jgi:hypothetical protein
MGASVAAAYAATTSQPATKPAPAASSGSNSAVNRQKAESQDAAEKTLIGDAVIAIAETQKASNALSKGDSKTALAALERATGKLDLLLARNPSTALLPVRVETIAIESAPRDVAAIKQISDRASRAVSTKDYPLARVLLSSLQEEIRVRTYNLPLATYPQAIKDAARLIDEKKSQEASAVLATALGTLVIVDHVFPEPTIKAQAAVVAADALKGKNNTESLRLVDVAKQELNRADALGYAGKDDPEYTTLQTSVADVEKQLRANHGLVSFDDLKTKLANFFKHQSEPGKSK